mmetsp:Transcript_88479/g.245757  ORF Transcript_88479/g.245757 Transcript_88479/m.245757 type:complete len:233 (+) Transcript_88479:452-1150(+)
MPRTSRSIIASRVMTTLASTTWPSSSVLASSFVAAFLYDKVRAKSPGLTFMSGVSLYRSALRISTGISWPTSEVSPTLSASWPLGIRPSRPCSVITTAPQALICITVTLRIGSVPSWPIMVASIKSQAPTFWRSVIDRMIWLATGSPVMLDRAPVCTTLASISSPTVRTSPGWLTGASEMLARGMKAQVLAPTSTKAPSGTMATTMPEVSSPVLGISQSSKVLPFVSVTKSS